MTEFNLPLIQDIETSYDSGLLPQRNHKDLYYRDTSCRSNLSKYSLSSENRRILRKTGGYSYITQPLTDFIYTPAVQKTIANWIRELDWDFPVNSIKTVFTNHIFNTVVIWSDNEGKIIAYAVCYVSESIAHIAYLFYNPVISHQDILIRIVLQFVIDCADKNLKYVYLGRFSKESGYYKRNMPGFEYYKEGIWQTNI